MAITASPCATLQIATPLIEAVARTFDLMLNCDCRHTEVVPHTDSDCLHNVNAIVGLGGDLAGSVCVSFDVETARRAVHRFVDVSPEAHSMLLRDGVGEFANVIVGAAREALIDQDLELRMSMPNIVSGDGVHLMFPSQSQPMRVTFESELGSLLVIFGLVSRN